MAWLVLFAYLAFLAVSGAQDGNTDPAKPDSFAPGTSVRCLKSEMYIALDRTVLSDYSVSDLTLKDTSCRAQSNKTHFSLKTPLVGCGTESKFTEEAVVYSNVVRQYRGDAKVISRIQDIAIPFSCYYTKEGVTSTFGLLPTRIRKFMDGGNGTTNFVLGMALFHDDTFSKAYGVADFPLRVTVNKPLFVQLSIDSPDQRLTVMADRCYATPTQNPNHVMQYDIINDGCNVDPTVVSYPSPKALQRFSVKAFKFLPPGEQFVYLHCHLVVCNVSDPSSRCAQGCSGLSGRLRRATHNVEAELTQGPLILDKKPQALSQGSESNWNMYILVMIGMGGFCVICLLAMVYMKKDISRRCNKPTADPDRESNV